MVVYLLKNYFLECKWPSLVRNTLFVNAPKSLVSGARSCFELYTTLQDFKNVRILSVPTCKMKHTFKVHKDSFIVHKHTFIS